MFPAEHTLPAGHRRYKIFKCVIINGYNSRVQELRASKKTMIHVLYVEDDVFSIEHLQKHFAKEGRDFEIDCARTTSEGLNLLQNREYDVLLVDYALPDGNGLDVLRKVHSAGLILPIVVITGNNQEELLTTVLRAGASDYIVKRGDYVAELPGILRNLAQQYTLRKKVFSKIPLHERRILYADVTEQDIESTSKFFRENMPGYSLEVVRSSRAIIDRLIENPGIDLVISELRIPNMSALEIIRACKHKGINVPFIILTSEEDQSTAVAALKLGAYDYIMKRTDYLPELSHSVENAIYRSEIDVLSLRLHSEIEQINASLEEKVRLRTGELQKEIERRRQSESDLTEALRQKDLLLMEIHHRVKNNLQIISSLINLQLRSTEDIRNQELLQTLASRVQSMALVHQALYNSVDFEKLDFSAHLQTLSSTLFDLYGVDRSRILLKLECRAIDLDINTAIPLSLIVNEIVSNSLKHAFTDGRDGVIVIRAKQKDAKVFVEIEDNGVGLPENVSTRTLGLKLIELLTRQIDAHLRVDRQDGTRYTVELLLPDTAQKRKEMSVRRERG